MSDNGRLRPAATNGSWGTNTLPRGWTVKELRGALESHSLEGSIDAPPRRAYAGLAGRRIRFADSPGPPASDEVRERASPLERIRRTKTVEWMVAYIAMGSLVLQLITVLCDVWSWSNVLQRATSLIVGLGCGPALVVVWYHGEQGRQRVCAAEAVLLLALFVVSGIVVWAVCFAR
jgi:hypothetical protein